MRVPSCGMCSMALADALHSYMSLISCRPQTICGLHLTFSEIGYSPTLGQTSWWTVGVPAGVNTAAKYRRGYGQLMLHQMVSNNLGMDTNLTAAAKLSPRLQHKAKEVWQSVWGARPGPRPRGCGNSPATLAHSSFFGCSHEQEGPRISAARRQQLLQQHRGNFLSHVTSLQGWHTTKGPKDDGTKGRRDVAKNANQADTALRFANF